MKHISYILLQALSLSCSLLNPNLLIIQNNSKFDILITIENINIQGLNINKGDKRDIILYPGKFDIKVEIPEIGYSKTYNTEIMYLEKNMFIFNLN